MKRFSLKTRLLKWWLFSFRNPKLYRFELGGFIVTFRRFWMEVETISDNFRLRVLADQHPYGYLLAAARQDRKDNIHGFCAFMYKISMTITTDQGLVDDLNRVLTKYDKRTMTKAAANVKKEKMDDQNLEYVRKIYEHRDRKK